MNAYMGVIVPATESVQPMQIPVAILTSTVAEVPPNTCVAGSDPAEGIPVWKAPHPITVELTPGAPTVRQTQVKSSVQGCAVVAPGVVKATTLAPIVIPAATVKPKRGVIINVPVEAKDMIPPAVTRQILPGLASLAAMGVKLETFQRIVSLVAVTAV